jgi:hypothetical protein
MGEDHSTDHPRLLAGKVPSSVRQRSYADKGQELGWKKEHGTSEGRAVFGAQGDAEREKLDHQPSGQLRPP